MLYIGKNISAAFEYNMICSLKLPVYSGVCTSTEQGITGTTRLGRFKMAREKQLRLLTWIISMIFNLCLRSVSGQGVFVDNVTLNTEYGEIQGMRHNYGGKILDRYLGIPFAKPPTGERRFMSPEEPEPWTGTLLTDRYQSSCVQDISFFGVEALGTVSEDCLYLNVFVPEGNNLPVMVWIHGGALSLGSASQYYPENMALSGEVIVVSINYRLGVFGFFTSGDDMAEGNAGMLDQVVALKWINNNIALFGGDDKRITIFGESAGAWSANMHMASPMSQGLFQRAICQSGAVNGLPFVTAQERAVGSKVLGEMLQSPVDDTEAMVKCLQLKPAMDVFISSLQSMYLGAYPPTIGGKFLPRHPDYYWEKMGTNPDHFVDLMIGLNSEEGVVYLMPGIPGNKTVDDYFTNGISSYDPYFWMLATFSVMNIKAGALPVPEDPIWNTIKDHYIQDENDALENMRALLDMAGHTLFYAPTFRVLQKVAPTGQRLYVYYFDQLFPIIPDSWSTQLPKSSHNFKREIQTFLSELHMGQILTTASV